MKRRDFFKIMGLASGAALTACKTDNADKKLLPYLIPPEDDIIPGVPRYLRSACMECPAHCGLDVKVMNDKPIKLEGNPDHPVNRGALCIRGQASLARLNDPNRIKQPLLKGANGKLHPVSWDEAFKKLQTVLTESRSKGLHSVYLSSRTTGALNRLIDEFCKESGVERLKEVEIFNHETIKAANQKLFGLPVIPHYRIDQADALVTIGADIFETCISPVEWARQYSEAKKNRLTSWVHIEPYLSLTGASANNRVVCNPGSEPYLLAYILRHITRPNTLSNEIFSQIPDYPIDKVEEMTGIKPSMITTISQTLDNTKNPLIICGGPAEIKSNGSLTALYTGLIQWALGMIGTTVDFDHSINDEHVGPLETFDSPGVAFFSRTHISKSFCGGLHPWQVQEQAGGARNPFRPFGPSNGSPNNDPWHEKVVFYAYFCEVLKKEPLARCGFKVALSQMPSPLTEICDLVLPLSDPLESWGDVESRKGLKTLVQPVLEPLYTTKTEGDILLKLMGKDIPFRDYLATQWDGMNEDWINKGFNQTNVESKPIQIDKKIELPQPGAVFKKDCLFIVPSIRTFDGRSSDLALLEEIPDPLTSVSYRKWLSVSTPSARNQNLSDGDMIELENGGNKVKLPVIINPGYPEGVMTLSIDVLPGLNFLADQETGEIEFLIEGIKITKTGQNIPMTILSGGKKVAGRGILPITGEHDDHHYKRHTLYAPHEHKNYRWGMVIDLDKCAGCSACVAACYIENNVPIVGPEEHLRGREMSWLRIEAYFDDPENPGFIPMMCQQCDAAPCENVCPVYATYHNPEGLNTQIYNRCVGTRYCANNCPFKARRFNWFDREGNLPLHMVSNPDISVRPKGVMEKCTFCSQRIRFAKDRAKDENRLVKDGEVIPACAQTCPTGAITFGSLMDPNSKVSVLAKSEGAYRALEELGIEPAVYYIKRKKKTG